MVLRVADRLLPAVLRPGRDLLQVPLRLLLDQAAGRRAEAAAVLVAVDGLTDRTIFIL